MAVPTFLGASVYSYSINQNNNEQSTQMNIDLVEDPAVNDDFWLKDDNELNRNVNGQLMGTAVRFQDGSFIFDGLILSWTKTDSIQGKNLYNVVISSPTMILDGVQVILSDHIGPVSDFIKHGEINTTTSFALSNVLNVYGYIESGGSNFGFSEKNDAGLYWEGVKGVKQALHTLSATAPISLPSQNYGSYIRYRGHNYYLDLTSLPLAPLDYRIGGSTSMSLLEIISRICEDGGCDYAPRLSLHPSNPNGPHRIWFKVYNRAFIPTLGKLNDYISGLSNVKSSSGQGQEWRNEIAQAMIVGGPLHRLSVVENTNPSDPAVLPFWGFAPDGSVIIGRTTDGGYGANDDLAFNLNATAIPDIIGNIAGILSGLYGINGLMYPCTVLEMRYALIDFDSWAAFMHIYKKPIADAISLGIIADFFEFNNDRPPFVQDLINDSLENLQENGEVFENVNWMTVAQRLYQFVRYNAEQYYGRKFLVRIPFDLRVNVLSNNVTMYTDELADAGFVNEESVPAYPLNISELNKNYFLDQTNRFLPFIRFALTSTYNRIKLTSVSEESFEYETEEKEVTVNFMQEQEGYLQPDTNAVYVPIQQGLNGPVSDGEDFVGGGDIVFFPDQFGNIVPAVVCSINAPIFALPEDPLGSVEDIASNYMLDVDEMRQVTLSSQSDGYPVKIHPAAFYPNGAAIATRSNRFNYGPWASFYTDGKAVVEQDSSLVPWEYGSMSFMNQAAVAKLFNIISPTQVFEHGEVTKVGVPDKDIGDLSILGGPVISSINVRHDINGILTTYNMESFVPKFGYLARDNADRFKRLGQKFAQLKRSMRSSLVKNQQNQFVSNVYQQAFLYGASPTINPKTPHMIMMGQLINYSGNYYPIISTQSLRESVANLGLSLQRNYRSTACVSFDTLFRPFSTNTNASGIGHYIAMDKSVLSSAINRDDLNPFKAGADFQWGTYGNTYNGANFHVRTPDYNNARFMALRGPLVVTGPGYTVYGKPVPNSVATGVSPPNLLYSNDFMNDYLTRSDKWMTGPVDLRWDKYRACWAAPGFIFGVLEENLNAVGGPAKLTVTRGDRTKVIKHRLADGPPGTDYDQIYVYNFFDTDIEAGIYCTCGLDTHTNKWYVISADCFVTT